MEKSERKKLEHTVNEKLIAMCQTNDLDRIYIFLSDLTETLTAKQLNAINLVISDYGFKILKDTTNQKLKTMSKNKIRIKFTGGLKDSENLIKTLESHAQFFNFHIEYTKVKHRTPTPLHDVWVGLISK